MSNDDGARPVLAIVGPTASGKSALTAMLARRWHIEVVNADAFSMYRLMDIGTAKPDPQMRRAVPHHLIDVLDIEDTSEVASYQSWARTAIDEIRRRGHLPVLIGGSGLYVNAVLDDLRFPGTDPAVREHWEQRLRTHGAEALHAILADVDPAAARLILPTNGRRIVRALEVHSITGEPFPADLAGARPWCDAVRIGLDRSDLDERIEQRVHRMWDQGFVAEVAGLEQRLLQAPTAAKAVGYRQVLDVLAGDGVEATARDRTIAATRKLARRQRSWFRRDRGLRWAQSPEQAFDLAVRLVT